jgi:hypothetical protein
MVLKNVFKKFAFAVKSLPPVLVGKIPQYTRTNTPGLENMHISANAGDTE